MHTKSNNVELMIGNETDKIIEERFESLLQRYQEGLEELVTGSEFVFDTADLLYYKCHQISLNCVGSHIDSPKWVKVKKATIDPKNNDDKCFQYALTVALNYQSIKKDPQRISKMKPFIDQYNWKEINFPSHKKDWNEFFLKKNEIVALNILFEPYSTEERRHAYKSKYNLNRENQVIPLIITNSKKDIIMLLRNYLHCLEE